MSASDREPVLSAEEAERHAAQFRPSWEIDDDSPVAPNGHGGAQAAPAKEPGPRPVAPAAGAAPVKKTGGAVASTLESAAVPPSPAAVAAARANGSATLA